MQSADPDNSIVPSIDVDRLLITLLNEKKLSRNMIGWNYVTFARRIGLMFLDGTLCKKNVQKYTTISKYIVKVVK